MIFFILAFFISIFIEEPNRAHKQIEGKHTYSSLFGNKTVPKIIIYAIKE